MTTITTQEQFVLTSAEQRRLQEFEGTIERGLQTFYEVGYALSEIREQRLYRAEYGTFEDYCQERWNMRRNYANKLIAASEIAGNLGTIVPKPENEAQTRPLAKLPPDEQGEAWEEAVKRSGGKPTAKVVEQVVKERIQPPMPEPEPEPAAAEEPEPEEEYIPEEAIEWAEEVLGVGQQPVEIPELPPGWYFQDSSNPDDIIAINRNNHAQTTGFCDTYVQAAVRAWQIHVADRPEPKPAQDIEAPRDLAGWEFYQGPHGETFGNHPEYGNVQGMTAEWAFRRARKAQEDATLRAAAQPAPAQPAPQGNPTGADVDIGIAPGAKVALRTVIGTFLKATQEPEGIRAWVRWPSGIVESVDPNILVVQEPEPEPEPDLPEQQPVAHPTIQQCMIDAYKLIKAGDTHRAKLQAQRFRAHPDVAGIIGHAIWGMQQAMEGDGDGE